LSEKTTNNDSEIELTVLRYVENGHSQKSLSEKIGISVGKTNYIIKALAQKGLIKIENFIANDNKRVYKYLLTKDGIAEKLRLTEAFIERKKREYEELQQELIEMRND